MPGFKLASEQHSIKQAWSQHRATVFIKKVAYALNPKRFTADFVYALG